MQPSIDTILVCRGLVDALRDMKPVQRLIDVGSGSGRGLGSLGLR
jgi:methylase of polypeptide subunit release factors